MILALVSMVALMCISALFAAFVSAVALTAAVWFIGAHLWARISGRSDV
jgi:hypothetical protein